MAPALFEVHDSSNKAMLWPIDYAPPGQQECPVINPLIQERAADSDGVLETVKVPESVVAISRFGDAIVEPVVRRVDQELREAIERDGMSAVEETCLRFAQYDAIFSMGQRRSEVHVRLNRHPW